MNSSLRGWLFILPFLLLSACLRNPLSPKTVDDLKPASPELAEEILNKFSERAQAVRSYRVLGNLTLSRALGKERLKIAAVAQNPGKIRLDLFATGLNQPVGLFVVSGRQFTGLDFRERKAILGEASPETISHTLGFALKPEEFSFWFLGLISVDNKSSWQIFETKRENEFVLRRQELSGREQRYLVQGYGHQGMYRVHSFEMSEGSEQKDLLFSCNYIYPETGEELLFPFPAKIEAELVEKSFSLELQYTKTDLNQEIFAPEKLFVVQIPQGMKHELVSE